MTTVAKNILYLFPDTNLFIQCSPLEQLDWSEWRDFMEVHLIVCLPVQQEIDQQKTRGRNDRVGRRARKTSSSLFRPIATGEKEYALIRAGDPRVKLFLESPSRPDPGLSDRLDYGKPDNEIVGCLHQFAKDNPDADARLLTDDTGPMMTARGLGLCIAPIRQEWRLPPESSEEEREIARLNTEIVQLKKKEPQFNIVCIDDEGLEVEKLELTHNTYGPLNEDDISKYIEILKDRFPITTEFDRQPPKPALGLSTAVFGGQSYFEPVSEEAIEKYRDHEYPKWIRDCRETLSDIHETLRLRKGHPYFGFEVANEGTRPGNHALVTIRAKGNFNICPPPYKDEDADVDGQTEPSIPSTPTPPHGRWRTTPTSSSRMLGLRVSGVPHGLDYPTLPVASLLPEKPRRDPNGFYYKPKRITEPSDTFSLECEQWRHETIGELFEGYIFLPEGVTTATGALECEIHAENLSKPVLRKIPVKVQIQNVSSADFVDSLVNPPWNEFFRS